MLPVLSSFRALRLLAFAACWLAAFAPLHAQQDTLKVKAVTVTLVADTTAIEAGKPFTAGVHFEIDPEWDVYWQFVGDIGMATKIDWELPPGFTAGPLQWPFPVAHLANDTFLNYVYFHETLLFVEITPPAQLPAEPISIKAKIKWQMCDAMSCVPAKAELNVSLSPGKAQPANADLFAKWRAQLPKTTAPPFAVKWDRSKADEFSLRIEGLPKESKAEFFPLPPASVKPGHPVTGEIAANGSRTVTFPVKNGQPDLPWRGVLTAGKDEASREAWLLDSTATTAATAPATATPTAAAKTSTNPPPAPTTPSPAPPSNASAIAPPQPTTPPSTPTPNSSTTATVPPSVPVATPTAPEHSLPAILWSAFLGGLILNLMPCVLPVIALKIFGFVQQAGEHPRRVFHLGLAFVAGVFAFFLGLAALIAVLHANGIGINWGSQFQHPAILITLIVMVFVFALNLLGVFEISLSGGTASKLSELSGREGYSGAFLHGMFTTLLGTSCTAPFLGAVLGFAFVAPTYIVFLIFTAIAAGMSLPYFLLTANPAWLRFLPKPGMWMERLKQLMGFIMLGVVVWLVGVFGGRGADSAIVLAAFLLVLSVACWIYGSFGHRLISWLAIIALLAGSYVVYSFGGNPDTIVWEPWTEQRVSEATQQGQPVFVDFTADWCVNCKVNEKRVLNTDAVSTALVKKKVLTLKADWTNYDENIAAILKKHGRAGVPAYLLYPGGNAEPILLPELLTQASVLSELDKLKN